MNKTSGAQYRGISAYNHGNNKKNNGIANTKGPTCTHCGFVGHTVDTCYNKHDYPPSCKPKLRNVSNVNQTST